MSLAAVQGGTNQALCILVKVKDSVCAIQSSYVEGLFKLEQKVTGAPDPSGVRLGMIRYRGSALSLLELRKMLGLGSQEAEQRAFDDMLEQRKHDHVKWVEELKRCMAEDEPFYLATDPHKCAFGKWYYSYEPTSHAVEFYLKKIEEPHAKLHQTALAALNCDRLRDAQVECLRESLKKGADYYMPQVLALLDEARQAFQDSYNRMVVVLSDGASTCGILVDEVLTVGEVRPVKDYGEFGPKGEPLLVTGVGQHGESDDLVLMLNGQRLVAAPAGEPGRVPIA